MSEKNPIIEQLEAAKTFTEMAAWLADLPLILIETNGESILKFFDERQFHDGGNYVFDCYGYLHSVGIKAKSNPPITFYLFEAARELDEAASLTMRRDLSWWQAPEPAHGD